MVPPVHGTTVLPSRMCLLSFSSSFPPEDSGVQYYVFPSENSSLYKGNHLLCHRPSVHRHRSTWFQGGGSYYRGLKTMRALRAQKHPGNLLPYNLPLAFPSAYGESDDFCEKRLPPSQKKIVRYVFWHFSSPSIRSDCPDTIHCCCQPVNLQIHLRHRSLVYPDWATASETHYASAVLSSCVPPSFAYCLPLRSSMNN